MRAKGEGKEHEGHRERMLNTIEKAGLSALSDKQVVEYLLTYIFPRGDTNDLAGVLLKRYKDLAGIIDADPVDMESVKGIGKRAAMKIHLFGELFFLYSTCKLSKKEPLKKAVEVYDYCEKLLRFSSTEELYIVGLNAKCELLDKRLLAKGSINIVGVNQTEIGKFIISTKPMYVFLLHNHPGGSALPSNQDIEATENLKKYIEMMGVGFSDHYIVGIDGIYSIKNSRLGREFIPLAF